jgi:hypothetical protein
LTNRSLRRSLSSLRRGGLALAGALSLLLVPALAAQETVPAPAPEAAPRPSPRKKVKEKPPPGRFRVGRLYFTPRLVLAQAGPDSNVNNSSDAPTSDTTVAFRPLLDVVLPVSRERLLLRATGGLGIDFFAQETSERSLNPSYGGGATLAVGRFTLFGDGLVQHQRLRATIETDERLTLRTEGINVGARVRITERLSTGYIRRHVTTTYDSAVVFGEDVKATLDQTSETDSVEVSFGLTQATNLVGSADFQKDRFRSEQSSRKQATSRRYLLGFQFTELAFLSGYVRAGVRTYPATETQAVRGLDAVVVSAGVGMPFVRGSRLELAASRDVAYSLVPVDTASAFARNRYILNHYSAGLAFELPADLITRALVLFESADYQGEAPQGSDPHYTTVQLSLLRAFGRTLHVGAVVSRSERTAREGSGYHAIRYGVTAEWLP